jgi:hypothetical protein
VPTWGQILKEVNESARLRAPSGPDLDGIRHKYPQRTSEPSTEYVIRLLRFWSQPLEYEMTARLEIVLSPRIHGVLLRGS